MIRWAIFFILTSMLLAFTWSRPHKHRFYRFFAFESLLGLIFLNASQWFHNPFSIPQIFSWLLLIGSIALVLHGFHMLRAAGAPRGDIENTTQLVSTGVYRYIRHPLYCSLILCGVGAYLKGPSLTGFILVVCLLIFVFLTARIEEQDNLERFGDAYRVYMGNTRMFIPFVI